MKRIIVVSWVVTGLLALGCGKAMQARKVEKAGFLADYSMLEESPDGAKFQYTRTGVDFTGYQNFLLDPVQFWRSADVDAGLSGEEAQTLINYFYAKLHEQFAKYYTPVDTPGPSTLRIQTAFTRLGGRNVTLDTVSTYVPQMLLLSGAKQVFTGKPAFTGKASFEAKVTDAQTHLLLAAAVDTRVGGKNIKGFDKWSDVRAAIDTWAESLGRRLCVLHGEKSC